MQMNKINFGVVWDISFHKVIHWNLLPLRKNQEKHQCFIEITLYVWKTPCSWRQQKFKIIGVLFLLLISLRMTSQFHSCIVGYADKI